MITRRDVAERAGVSVATVSNVLNKKGIVQPETEKRVYRAVEELGYIPDETARNLSLGRSNHIGVALNELTNPYHMEVVHGIERQASASGFHVTVCNIEDCEQSKLEFLNGRRFDVLVNFMTMTFSEKILEMLLAKNTLLVNFPIEDSLMFHLDSRGTLKECMKLLHDHGHTRVGYVSTIDSMRWVNDPRGIAYLDHLRTYGFENRSEYVVFNDDYAKDSSLVGYENGLKLFRAHPEITAVFVSNDIAALGVMRALKELGLRCPEDVSVIGYDGIQIGRLFTPSLTTVGYDNVEYGKEMAKRVIERILHKAPTAEREFIFPAKLILGESVGPCLRK